jgi:DNA-binding NtrC family response regulator
LLPPLRERSEDIEDIAGERLRELAVGSGRGPWELTADAIDELSARPWPGNVRELLHAIERPTIVVPKGAIDRAALRSAVFESTPDACERVAAADGAVLPFADAERQLLKRALEATKGKIYGDDGAAALLRLKPTTLQAKLKKHRLK